MDVQKFQVVLSAKDFEKTTAFYGAILGLPVSHSWDRNDGRGAYFACGDAFIEVLDEQSAKHVEILEHGDRVGVTAKALRVGVQVSEVDALHRELEKSGERPTPLVDVPWGHRSFRVADPDGVVLTFYAERDV